MFPQTVYGKFDCVQRVDGMFERKLLQQSTDLSRIEYRSDLRGPHVIGIVFDRVDDP
jgi:hypothetical protein